MVLQRTDARSPTSWGNHHSLPAAEGAPRQSARHHRADAAQAEDAVHGQAWLSAITRSRRIGQDLRQSLFQLFKPAASHHPRFYNRTVRRIGGPAWVGE